MGSPADTGEAQDQEAEVSVKQELCTSSAVLWLLGAQKWMIEELAKAERPDVQKWVASLQELRALIQSLVVMSATEAARTLISILLKRRQ